jgi:predicted dehydrogenase
MGRDVGFGVVGCGVVAGYHINGILETPGARLAAVSDVVEGRAREFGERHRVAWTTDYHDLLKREDIDVINVCTPNGMRLPLAEEAARAGKHLVVEKPIAISLREADRIIEACEKAGVRLMCVFQLRYGRGAMALRRAIQEGRLGRIVLADATVKWFRPQAYYDSAAWRGTWAQEGGGALMTQGIHTVDLLQWMMGPVRSVSARMATLVHRIEVEDTIVAALTYASGALGAIEATTAAHPGLPARIEVCGDRGTVALEADQITTWQVEGMERPADVGGGAEVGRAASDSKTFGAEGHRAQIAEMVEVVRAGKRPAIDGPEGRRAVELVLAIYESARTGRTVELPLT